MCLLLYYANYIRLLNKVSDDVTGLSHSLKKLEKERRNDQSLLILETKDTDHEPEKDRKSKWALNFSWKFWKMWKIGKKVSNKNDDSQVHVAILLPKKSEISVVRGRPFKMDSSHVILMKQKPHFEWRFWKRKCTKGKSIGYLENIRREQSGKYKLEKQLASKLRTREMLYEQRPFLESRDRDTRLSNNNYPKNKKSVSKYREDSFDSIDVHEVPIRKSKARRCLHNDHLSEPRDKSTLKSYGTHKVIVASAYGMKEGRESTDEDSTARSESEDSEYSYYTEYYEDPQKVVVQRNEMRPNDGSKDKRKEWLTHDDTLIKEADINDPDIKKRDIIPRKKRRSRFDSFDMKTTIVSETPTPQSPYAKKKLSGAYVPVYKKAPKKRPPPPRPPPPPRDPTPEPKREPTPEPEREPTPEPEREPTPEPVLEIEPEPESLPPPKPAPKPAPKPEPKPKLEPVCAAPAPPPPKPVKQQDGVKLRIPLKLANTRVQIRVPKRLLIESLGAYEQNGSVQQGRGGTKRPCKQDIHNIGVQVLEDEHSQSQFGCIFKRAFGCFMNGDDSSDSDSEYSDDEEEVKKCKKKIPPKCPTKKKRKCQWNKPGKQKRAVKFRTPKKPYGTSIYKCIQSVKTKGFCCCCVNRRTASKKVCIKGYPRVVKDSTVDAQGKGSCCPCRYCFPRKKPERCQCRNPNCGDNLRAGNTNRSNPPKREQNPSPCRIRQVCRSYADGLHRRHLSRTASHRPRMIFVKRRGRHYHSLLDDSSSDESSSSSDYSNESSSISSVSRGYKSSRRPMANYSVDVVPLRNEWTQASYNRLKSSNSMRQSYLLYR